MTQNPRILALIGSRVIYGQERANLHVLEALRSKGCEILAVVEDHPAYRAMPEELDKRDIAFVEAPAIGRRAEGRLLDFLIGNPLRYIRLRKKLRNVVRKWKPTHIHVPNPFSFLMAEAIAGPHLPIIYRIGDKPSSQNFFWRWIWRRVVRGVTHFVADSAFIARELEAIGVDGGRITVIFTPPQRRLVPPQPHVRPEHPQQILFIGQLSPDKGLDRLVAAFKLLAPQHEEAHLTIVGRLSSYSGDDWQRDLRDQTLADPVLGGRVSFVGEREDVYSCLASAAFLAVPSVLEEAFGLVVGEAKAAARPSVIFPSGGLPEQVVHLEDGFICRDTSVEALAEGLSYYLSSPSKAHEHGLAALASLARLGSENFAQAWIDIFRDTLASNPDTRDSMGQMRIEEVR